MIRKLQEKRLIGLWEYFFVLIGVFVALAFVLAATGRDSEKEQASKIIFIQHIMPKTLQEGYKNRQYG
ncbi:hypothetical protein [Helicobacter rodentium]|uniref:hypothetical protein n=1 Tax=uncultured Helicobacter sp. TaxID=175537 RepID=UPI000513AB67|nr:hypothetical protein [Helicobacter rodentium]